ncbi:Nif3-like dinuclear metal center hexameric protein [uncultured Ilyobacter sp.]|uniref:Nif3-like dinuclear metal center hexameric protein n=1 Tax=uncultured Ilyobacter sp. TaxID=544433 RepID=UPI0029C98FB1|nr:Nif3-like dinuclear metal center hexameric protein [uncultured Ilyobacter sp.]
MRLSEITKKLEKTFPRDMAESWDNVGLLVGERNKDIKKIQISLDATEGVIEEAVKNKVDLIITHHPLIFSPLKAVNDSTMLGKKIIKLIKNDIALYSMHTNIDSAENGLNRYIAELIGAKESKIISQHYRDIYKLAIYVPKESYLEVIRKIQDMGVSLEGYDGVSYSTECLERYKLSGEEDVYTINNMKIEVIGEKSKMFQVLNEIRKIHSYDEVAYEIFSIENKYIDGGIGRFFSLENPLSFKDYVEFIKEKLSIEALRIVAANEEKQIKKVAVINGSGMSFLKKIKKLDVDVFITGDIKYHEALDAAEEGLDLIDLGHYESEHFFNHLVKDELFEFKDVEIKVINEKPIFKYR